MTLIGKNIVWHWAFPLVMLLLAGCTGRPLRVPMPERTAYDATRGHAIKQRACGFMLGGAVPIAMSERYQRGYDALIKQVPGEYVTDVKVREVLRYAFVGWRYCAFFEAMAYPKSL